jgi:hypothetical protein
MPFKEDFTAFLNTDEHASQIVLQGRGDIINGILEREYIESNEISGYRPIITATTKDLECLNRGDIVEVDGVLYRYIYQEPDGTGMSQAVLEFAG